jgi:hypothetical protein
MIANKNRIDAEEGARRNRRKEAQERQRGRDLFSTADGLGSRQRGCAATERRKIFQPQMDTDKHRFQTMMLGIYLRLSVSICG